MAPRRGNKVKPSSGNDTEKSKPDKDKPFFIKPASRGSTTNNIQIKKGTITKPKKHDFDKKKWRLQRYSKKYKLEQWENNRKKAVLREYYKQIDDKPAFDVKKIYKEEEEKGNKLEDASVMFEEEEEEEIKNNSVMKKKGKVSRKRAHEELKRIEEEKRKAREENLRKKVEKREALKEDRAKRAANFKRLNKKTKWGQPVMKDRMEMLLERIQKSLGK